MNWWEHIGYALTMTLTHKMRAFLTTLGIIIGIISVTVMISLGNSFNAQMKSSFKETINLLTVFPRPLEVDGVLVNASLTNNDVTAIKSSSAILENISPEVQSTQTATYNATKEDVSVVGSTPDYYVVHKENIIKGRAINQADLQTESKVAVISEDMIKDFFKGADPIGKDIQVGKYFFTVVGVLKKKTTLFSYGELKILIPLTTAQNHFSTQSENISWITVKVADYKNMTSDKREVIYALLKSRGIADAAKANFTLSSDVDIQKEVEKSFKVLNIFLGGIGAISLLVGGIGVMNIMLVSVTERTREIGIRKALGAKRSDILWQFLIESVVVSVIGGILGVAGSYIIVTVINFFAKRSLTGVDEIIFFVSPGAILLALSSALTVGIFFGIFPAHKASKLRPIDALRFE